MPEPPEPVRDLDWDPDRVRELGEDAVELWVELLVRLPELPVSRELRADELHEALAIDIPEEPLERGELLRHLRALLLENSMYPGHPGFLAYVSGAGTVPGAAADLLAAALNQNSGGFRLSPGATTIEAHLMRWLAGRFGLPAEAGGHVVAGGAVANLVGLKLARDRASEEARERGVRDGPRLAFYASTESHVVHQRAADLLGIGSHAVRPIEVDDGWRLRPEALADAIERDLAAGEGAFSVRLKELGHEVTAIDFSDENWKAPEIALEMQNLDGEFAEKILAGDNKFDAVIAIEIIEHLENPFRFARECAKLLKSGGLLFLTTPNVEAVQSRLIFLYTGRLLAFGDYETVRPAHITPIFKWKLEMLLGEAGFEIVGEEFNRELFAERNYKMKLSAFIARMLSPFVKGEKGDEGRIIIARLK